ncbi:MAG: PD40 domain-containing protein [Actinobacteria bacterium]|nr:PD40 domain-containing protein [Actinomycetota bacterium]
MESTLFTVKPDGTGESRLVGVDPYSSLAWSPDGSKIAFGRRGIRVLSLGTGEVTTLCETPCRSPAWSPDGKSLAFIRSGNLNNDLWIMDADGSEPRDLLKDAELAGSAPAWSPDGKLIAVILEGDSGDGAGQRILLVDASTGEPVREIVTEVPSFVGGLSWFPDATRITFDVTSSSGGDGIYVVSRDGTGLSPISSCSEEGCSDRYPSVSPDGMRITFTRARCDEPGGDCSFGDIMVMSIDGTDLRSVTSGDDLDCCPAWQPLPSSGRAERD